MLMAMCLLAMALISAAATTGALRLQPSRLLATVATIVAVVVVAVAGHFVARSCIALVEGVGVSETTAGALLTTGPTDSTLHN